MSLHEAEAEKKASSFTLATEVFLSTVASFSILFLALSMVCLTIACVQDSITITFYKPKIPYYLIHTAWNSLYCYLYYRVANPLHWTFNSWFQLLVCS